MIENNINKSKIIEDVTEQTAMQPWVDMEFVQLGRGSHVGLLESVDLKTQQLVRERQHVAVQKLGVTPPNLCTVSCCTPDSPFRFSERRTGCTDAVFFLPGNTEFDVYVSAGARTTYVSFDQEEFLSSMRVLDPENWGQVPNQMCVLPGVRQAVFERAVTQWFRTAGRTRQEEGALRQGILQEILEIMVTSRREEPKYQDRLRAFHLCRAARGYVEDRLAEDTLPTIVEICRHFNVSERTLQYAFLSYVDLSPLAYLRVCRLNKVRTALRQPASAETTVTEVATRFGFFHLGKFSRYYRLQFGEAPSRTLARSLDLGT